MSGLNLIQRFSRLSFLQSNVPATIRNLTICYRGISTTTPLLFRATPCLMAEPLKKKKRLDPAVIKAREDRKKKKIEKQIRRLQKNARQLKPLDECEVALTLLDAKQSRQRNELVTTGQLAENRALLEKQWAAYKCRQHLTDIKMLDRMAYAQQRALDELRRDDAVLYEAAVQVDAQLVPFISEGPRDTPAIKRYDSPDGDYLDVSKKWQ